MFKLIKKKAFLVFFLKFKIRVAMMKILIIMDI